MEEMGVTPATVLAVFKRRGEGKYTRLADVKDPIYDWLVEEGRVRGHNAEWVDIKCPWSHLHSDKEIDGAGYSPLDYGTAGRAFKCFHSHGDQHTLFEFLDWVEVEHGIGPDKSVQAALNKLNKEKK